MAEIIQQESGKKKGGKRRPKKHSAHIDMTPMVDLMCLLITFFMLTTAFAKPKVMEVILPDKKPLDNPDQGQKIPKDRTLNIIIGGEDHVYWYIGIADPKEPLPTLNKTDYSADGIRKVLLDKNKTLAKLIFDLNDKVIKGEIVLHKDSLPAEIKRMKKEDKVGPIVLIKADDTATYKNVVDIIDEMAIANIARYSIVDMTPTELGLLKSAK